MTIADVKKAINALLREKYQSSMYELYGVDTSEGYARPCFFVKIVSDTMEAEGLNRYDNHMTCYIDYIQDKIDEADMLSKMNEIREMFQLCFKVGDRSIHTSNFEYDFVGSKRNILEMSFNMQFYTEINKKETSVLMEHVELRKES